MPRHFLLFCLLPQDELEGLHHFKPVQLAKFNQSGVRAPQAGRRVTLQTPTSQQSQEFITLPGDSSRWPLPGPDDWRSYPRERDWTRAY